MISGSWIRLNYQKRLTKIIIYNGSQGRLKLENSFKRPFFSLANYHLRRREKYPEEMVFRQRERSPEDERYWLDIGWYVRYNTLALVCPPRRNKRTNIEIKNEKERKQSFETGDRYVASDLADNRPFPIYDSNSLWYGISSDANRWKDQNGSGDGSGVRLSG